MTTNNMIKIEKRIATLEEVHDFCKEVDSKYNLKQSVTLDKNYDKRDTLICYSGNTHKGTLVSVWSRKGSKRKEADYGLRISDKMYDTLAGKSNAIKILFGDMHYEDSNEYRLAFYSLDDVKMFLDTLYRYLETATAKKRTTKDIEEVVMKEA